MTSERKERFLLVDGNNVIHAWSDLLALHRRRRGTAHLELCRRLRAYHDGGDERVVVVFDGRGEKVEEEREKGGFQVIYTDGGSTADDVIERLSLKYSGRYELTVATDDLAEQQMVMSHGAHVMSADGLRKLLERSEGNWRRWV